MDAPKVRKHRKLPKRYRLSRDDYRLNTRKVDELIQLVRASGVVEVLEAVIGQRRDAEERTSIRLVVTASIINARRIGHRGHIAAIAAVIGSLDQTFLNLLGSPRWTERGGYDRVQRLITRIAATLDQGVEYTDPQTGKAITVDHRWYRQSLLWASIPKELVTRTAVAVDGTAMETSGRFHGDTDSIPLDGDYRKDDPDAKTHQETAKLLANDDKKKAKVLGVGPDGRNIYTKDRDARAGWRTATTGENAGFYIGREVHIGVAVAGIHSTNRTDQIRLRPDVPPVMLFANITPAGAHRGEAVVPYILELHEQGIVDEVVADPGYTLATPTKFHLPLKKAGVQLTMKPASHQRNPKTFDKGIILDGQLFSAYTPADAWELPDPPRGLTAKEKEPYIEAFNKRARYRYSVHARLGDGAVRYIDPFASGKLRCEAVPKTLRASFSRPTVVLPVGFSPELVNCTMTVGADELPLEQPTVYGTSSWHVAYGRRNLVETANSQIKGGFADIRRGYTRHLDTGRILFHLAATLAIYNFNIMERWNRHPDIPEHRKPRSDRVARWSDLDIGAQQRTADPPD